MGIIGSILGKGKVWYLKNTDTGQIVQGQFPAENVMEKLQNRYGSSAAVGRQDPILQFLGGESDRVSFTATLFNRDMVFASAKDDLDKIKLWMKIDVITNRPPILSFWVGSGMVEALSCIMESVDIAYDAPILTGDLKRAVLNISLIKYEPYNLESVYSGETRYHQAQHSDYYEMLALREYGDPMLGDALRKRHPDIQTIQTGDTIKIPSKAVFNSIIIEPKSDVFYKAYGKKRTSQKSLLEDMIERRNRNYVSHVL